MSTKHDHAIIAETFSWDQGEVAGYRYGTYVSPRVYAIGDKYYAVHATPPKHDVGGAWRENADQFGARGTTRTLWVCDATEESATESAK